MLESLLSFFILYLPFQVALNPAPGFDLASVRILAVIIFLIWIARSLKKHALVLPAKWPFGLVVSFLFFSAFSLFAAQEPERGGRKLLFLLSFFPIYFVVNSVARKRGPAERIISLIVVSAAGAALVGLVQFALPFLIGLDPALELWRKIIPFFLGENFARSVLEYPSWLVAVGGKNFFRAFGFFPDPHMFSLFLGLAFPWAILLAFRKTERREPDRFLWISFALLILLADLLSFSRGGLIGLFGGGLIAFFFYFKDRRVRYLSAGLLLAAFIILSVPNPIGERFRSSFSPTEGSNRERLRNWKEGFQIAREHPWTGVGIGNYSLSLKPTAGYREPIYAHNLYLDLAAETGIFACLAFILLLISAGRNFFRSVRSDHLRIGGALSLVIFSFHSFFESGLYSVQVLPLLIIILALGARENYELE